MIHGPLDRRGAQLPLDVGRRSREIQCRGAGLDQPRGGHRRQRTLHVRGENEPLLLVVIGHGERHDVPDARALGTVRQRRRHLELEVACGQPVLSAGWITAWPSSAAHRACAPPALAPDDHAPRILGQHHAAGIVHRIRAEVILVIVAHEDVLGPGGVGRDPIVGTAGAPPTPPGSAAIRSARGPGWRPGRAAGRWTRLRRRSPSSARPANRRRAG